MNNEQPFRYTYSAKEQDELRAIRQKYEDSPEEDTMTRVRRLDAAATKKATVVSLILGILGSLLLGSGMSLIMTELSSYLQLDKTAALLTGIPLGLIGIPLIAVAYPVYRQIAKRERKKIAPEILRLTDELLK